MQNKNKMIILLSNTKNIIKENKKKIFLSIIILFILVLIINKIIENQMIGKVKQDIIQKTKIEILVEKQSENLKIIWKSLEDQKSIRSKINELQKSLDLEIDQVKNLEQENSSLRSLMFEDANDFNN